MLGLAPETEVWAFPRPAFAEHIGFFISLNYIHLQYLFIYLELSYS